MDAERTFAGCPRPRYIGGGQTILPALRQGHLEASDLIDLSELKDLRGVSVSEGTLSIGASETHAAIAADSTVRKAIPSLSELAVNIGDAQVRNRGTLGGAIAACEVSSDWSAALLGLDGAVHAGGEKLPIDHYIDSKEAASRHVIQRLTFQIPYDAVYLKHANAASGHAIVGLFAARLPSGVRVSLTGIGHRPWRWQDLEKALDRHFHANSIDECPLSVEGVLDDQHASAQYRTALIITLARRAVERLVGQTESH